MLRTSFPNTVFSLPFKDRRDHVLYVGEIEISADEGERGEEESVDVDMHCYPFRWQSS